jgi:transposase
VNGLLLSNERLGVFHRSANSSSCPAAVSLAFAPRLRALRRAAAKIPALREALEGRFEDEHALIVGQILAHIDFLDEAIDRLSEEIEERIRPFARQRDLLMTIPGVKQRTADLLIAEIGVGMGAFPTPKHLASWAKVCPGNTNPLANAAQERPARATSGSGRA